MTGCYLTSLPFAFMRAAADFDPEWSGSYFVPRTVVKPPATLLTQVWPDLDKWKEAHNSSSSELGVEQNMAAGAFLELAEWLREVLLQDAVFLRESYPDHPLFQDPVFSCPEFATFASKVRSFCQQAHEDSHTTAIQKSMPVVAEKLRVVLSQQTAAEQLADRRHMELLAVNQDLSAKLDELSHASYTITYSPGRRTVVQQVEVPRTHQQRREIARDITPTPTARPSPAIPLIQSAPPPEQEQGSEGSAQDEQLRPPSFKLPRSVKSVQDLLRLWRQGLAGMPSVDALEREWGSRWRPSTEKNYFSTRKVIVDEVRRQAQSKGLAEDIIARQMDEERGSNSLDKLFKAIREAKKGREA